MPPPILLDRYSYATLEPRFSREISERFHAEGVQVHITSSTLADLDHDGASDDLAGTALLQVGRRFKSFIFLMTDDGRTRFLENNGAAFDPSAGLRVINCEPRPWMCDDLLETAARRVRPARFSVMEFDTDTPGAEIVIRLSGGLRAIVNSLEVFAGE